MVCRHWYDTAGNITFLLICCRRTIEQSNLDGNNRQVVIEGLDMPQSLVVFGHHVYWVDRTQCMLFIVN